MLRGDLLQAAKERVGRSVRAGQEHAEPAEHGRKQREEVPGLRQGQRHRRALAGVVGDVGEAQHEHDAEDGVGEFLQCLHEGLHALTRLHAQHRHADERGEENAGASARKPVQLVARGVGRRFGHDGRDLHHLVVQRGHVPVQHHARECAVRLEVKERFERGQAPHHHEQGEQQKGRPRLEHAASRHGGHHRAVRRAHRLRCRNRLNLGGFPHLQEPGGGEQADECRGDVGQFRPEVVGGEVLRDGEGQPGDQQRGPQVTHALHARFGPALAGVHQVDHEKRHEAGQQRQLPPGDGPDGVRRNPGQAARHRNRNAERPKRDGRGVGNQAQASGVQGVEAQADQQRRRNRHRRTEAGGPFQKRAEAKADEHHEQALVFGDAQHRLANHLKLPGLDRHFVQKHGSDNNPRNRPQPVAEAVEGGPNRLGERHPVPEHRHQKGEQHRDGARHVPLEAQAHQSDKKENDWNQCDQGGQPDASPDRRVILRPDRRGLFHLFLPSG